MKFRPALAAVAALSAFAAGCSMNLNPFAPRGPAEVRRDMGGATEYRCEGNRRFWVRRVDAATVWLIAPDREVRLSRLGAEGSQRFGVGNVVLELEGSIARLSDPPAAFASCSIPSAEPEKPAAKPKP